jgi:hypothetical protein
VGRVIRITMAMAGALALLIVSGSAARPDDRAELLKVREAVWRAWFANDTKALEALVPPNTIVISSGEESWKNQTDILQSAAKFQAAGGKLAFSWKDLTTTSTLHNKVICAHASSPSWNRCSFPPLRSALRFLTRNRSRVSVLRDTSCTVPSRS